MIVSAPGKLVICGEYAVLEGYPAVATAVNRRVYVRSRPDERAQIQALGLGPYAVEWRNDEVVIPSDTRKQMELLRHVYRECGEGQPLSIEIDSSELYQVVKHKREKLGLGSSAAVAVALTATLRGGDKGDIFTHAMAAHRAEAQGKGSGIDIAASCYGGFIEFSLTGAHPQVRPLEVKLDPKSVLLVFSKQSAQTRYFVGAVTKLKSTSPAYFQTAMKNLGEISNQIKQALVNGIEWKSFTELVRLNVAILTDLGQSAGIQIVTDTHQTIAKIAQQCGGSAKPSGAGGGDVAICFVPAEHRDALILQLAKHKLAILPVELGSAGVM